MSTVAKVVLSDFQRGKLPYFVQPPPLPQQPAAVSSVWVVALNCPVAGLGACVLLARCVQA